MDEFSRALSFRLVDQAPGRPARPFRRAYACRLDRVQPNGSAERAGYRFPGVRGRADHDHAAALPGQEQ